MSAETVAIVVLLREDEAALLQHRDDKPGLRHAGLWVIPGGHCEPGEALEAGASRELEEETGYRCEALHWLKSLEDRHDPRYPSYQLEVFWARYDGRQPVTCREGQALAFIPRREADRHAIPKFLVDIWDEAIAVSRPGVLT